MPTTGTARSVILPETDSAANMGAFEPRPFGKPVERPEEPVEIRRILRGFDPWLACSTHVMSPDGEDPTATEAR
jgi:hydrogenase large subunit